MTEIKEIVDELGIDALEKDTKIAAVAVISDQGDLLIQTSNWDLKNETNTILNIPKMESSFNLNKMNFEIRKKTNEALVGTNKEGKGHVLIRSFQGGMLVAYAMPSADPSKALDFLKDYAIKLNGTL